MLKRQVHLLATVSLWALAQELGIQHDCRFHNFQHVVQAFRADMLTAEQQHIVLEEHSLKYHIKTILPGPLPHRICIGVYGEGAPSQQVEVCPGTSVSEVLAHTPFADHVKNTRVSTYTRFLEPDSQLFADAFLSVQCVPHLHILMSRLDPTNQTAQVSPTIPFSIHDGCHSPGTRLRVWSADGKVVLAEAHSMLDVSGSDRLQIFLRTPRGTKIVRVAPHATMQEAVSCIRFDAPGGTWKAHCQAKCIQPSDQLSAHGIRDQDCITMSEVGANVTCWTHAPQSRRYHSPTRMLR